MHIRTITSLHLLGASVLLSACAAPAPVVEAPAAPVPPSEPVASAEPSAEEVKAAFEAKVVEYIKAFPYQDTHDYVMKYTGGDASKINTWVLGEEPILVEAGQDKVVRMNNDTFYKMAFVMPKSGPVVLSSTAPSDDRFFSFQLMDDRNVNFKNVIRPDGDYTLYRGEIPAEVKGEAIEVPSDLSVVIVRVEVKDKSNKKDVAAAEKVFAGISIQGPKVTEIPKVDLLVSFDKEVTDEAKARMTKTFEEKDFNAIVPRLTQTVGKEISFLDLAAGTMGGWGAPDPHHSAYETIFHDAEGKTLVGSEGPYTLTTEAPPVKAFWSITVYDTDRGGFLHANPDNRYHINGTTAVKGKDGKYSFVFKQECTKKDTNCLAIPAGKWDMAVRYYEPEQAIISSQWKIHRAQKLSVAK